MLHTFKILQILISGCDQRDHTNSGCTVPRLRRSSATWQVATGSASTNGYLAIYHIIPQLLYSSYTILYPSYIYIYIWYTYIFINWLAPLAWTPCWQPQPPLLRLLGEQNHVATWSIWAHNRQGPEEEYLCKLYLSVKNIYLYIGAYNHRRSIMYISLFTQLHIFQNVYQQKIKYHKLRTHTHVHAFSITWENSRSRKSFDTPYP